MEYSGLTLDDIDEALEQVREEFVYIERLSKLFSSMTTTTKTPTHHIRQLSRKN